MVTLIVSMTNMETELWEMIVDENGKDRPSGCKPIKFPTAGRLYVPSSKLEKKGRFRNCVMHYRIFVIVVKTEHTITTFDKVDTDLTINTFDLKENGRIDIKKNKHGEFSTLPYPVSGFYILKLRMFSCLRGNDYPLGRG